jgi:hypothetical protein
VPAGGSGLTPSYVAPPPFHFFTTFLVSFTSLSFSLYFSFRLLGFNSLIALLIVVFEGIFASLAGLMFNCVRKEDIDYSPYDEGEWRYLPTLLLI